MKTRYKKRLEKVLSVITLISLLLTSFPNVASAATTSIRQEVNIIDGYLYAGANAYATSSAIIAVTDTNYTAPLYYFEVVASTTSGTSASVYLVNATSSAVISTITVDGGNAYSRYRSSVFLPASSSTVEYKVKLGNENVGKGITAARIIILQSADPIVNTETQIEIGNQQVYTDTSTSTFSSPKYWYYDENKWNGTPTFYAEVTYDTIVGVASSTTYSTAGTYTVNLPNGTASTSIGLWGGGGSGGGTTIASEGGDGGAGGQFASSTLVATTSMSHTLVVAATRAGGGAGVMGIRGATSTWDGSMVVAGGGAGGLAGTSVSASTSADTTGCVGTICYKGGNAGAGAAAYGPGGGEGAASTGNGNSATGAGVAGTGGAGGDGGAKITSSGTGSTGTQTGGGGGGGFSTNGTDRNGGTGAAGQAIITSYIATTSIVLQQDDGVFGTWTNVADIVELNAETGQPTRIRSAPFTPVSGRNYRIAYKNYDDRTIFAIYNAKIVVTQNWYEDDTWSYRKTIVIDDDKIPGEKDLKNFPILVNFTDSNLTSNAQSDGDDILFTLGNDTAKLSHEIEKYTSATGEIWAWVKVPVLDAKTPTVLHMYYGSSTASSQQDPTGVWDTNFAGVWHLGETVTDEQTSDTHFDSTSNNLDGTQSNNSSVSGKIAGAQSFDGTDDRINIPDNATLEPANLTFCVWVQTSAASQITQAAVIVKDLVSPRATPWTSYKIKADSDTAERYHLEIGIGGTNTPVQDSGVAHVPGTWQHVCGKFDASIDTHSIYVDGALKASAVRAGDLDYSNGQLSIGAVLDNTEELNGLVDEVKISSTVRSDDWITTEYNNQNATSTFYTVGSQKSYSATTKLQPQYLLANTATTTTGLTHFNTLYDSAEWTNVTATYIHQIDSSTDTSDSAKLQSNVSATAADVTNSTATGANRATSTNAGMTMPSGTAAERTISTYVLNAPIYGSRILVDLLLSATNPTLTHFHYRWRYDDGTEVGATYSAAEDTVDATSYVGDRRRVRFLISNTGGATASDINYLLEHSSSTCEVWLAVPTIGSLANQHWVMTLSDGQVSEGSVTTNLGGLTDPGGGDSFVSGYVQTISNQTSAISLSNTEFTELEYSIKSTGNVTPGTTYCFRLTNAGSTTNFGYDETPTATVLAIANRPETGGGSTGAGGETGGSGSSVSGGGPGGGGGGEESPPAPDPGQGGGDEGGGGGGDSGFLNGKSNLAAVITEFSEVIIRIVSMIKKFLI